MIRVGILGCGKIADDHAAHIRFVEGCKLVSVCDLDDVMAKQLCERSGAEGYFTDVQQFLESSNPDVVHITTPPHTHYELTRTCVLHGCHVYVEKPFTLNAADADDLVRLATEKNVKLTVGHNGQYNHAIVRMRKLVGEGFLGGPPNHLECYFTYNLGEPAYAKAVLGDREHWVRNLPGKLMHNVISHGISKIAEYFPADDPTVISHGFASPTLQQIHETDIIDELRVIISDDRSTTAYFTFSTQMRPLLHQFRLYGSENGLIADEDHETVVKLYGKSHKSFLNQFVPPLEFSGQYLRNAGGNMSKFMRRNFHSNIGMKILIESFYRSIRGEGPLPFSYRDIVWTTKIMDEIFRQVFRKTAV